MINSVLRILLINDAENDYHTINNLLIDIPEWDIILTRAKTCAEGLSGINNCLHDIYLIDYWLYSCTGIDLLQEAITQGCTAPIIILTGQQDREIDRQAIRAGAADCLIKDQLTSAILERAITHAFERNRIETRLKTSLMQIEQAKLEWEATVDSLPQLVCLVNQNHQIVRLNRTVEQWGLRKVTAAESLTLHNLLHSFCDSPVCPLHQLFERAWQTLATHTSFEQEIEDFILKRTLHIQIRPITTVTHLSRELPPLDSYAVITIQDITQRKQLESQLRQSQKMETMGQLAGGIAHDFNNLLTAILGYSQFLRKVTKDQDPIKKDLQEIENAAQRAAALTRQLLTFSRQQVLQPRVLNLNAIIANINKLLGRLIGENINLITNLDENLGDVNADPGQIEQIIVNLAVNARDAMPESGTITLATANLTLKEDDTDSSPVIPAGSYVVFSISDTGYGIPPDVLPRIFDPFFTTKEQGKGTGLGLATVQGIINQNNGLIRVQSDFTGTTFWVYLPCYHSSVPQSSSLKQTLSYPPVLRGTETILLVEDEMVVRDLARFILTEDGYTVLEARHGAEAIQLFADATRPIDLLITDLIMPGGLSGRQLAEHLTSLSPSLKVLYMSGYTDKAMLYPLQDETIRHFLAKPFTPDVLSHKVRDMLTSPAQKEENEIKE